MDLTCSKGRQCSGTPWWGHEVNCNWMTTREVPGDVKSSSCRWRTVTWDVWCSPVNVTFNLVTMTTDNKRLYTCITGPLLLGVLCITSVSIANHNTECLLLQFMDLLNHYCVKLYGTDQNLIQLWMNEWIYSLDRITVSQAGTPRHDNCMRLLVSWKAINNWLRTIVKTSITNKSYWKPVNNWLCS